MIAIHLACAASTDSWLDPGPVSQVVGAIVGGACSVGIALAVWRAEGRRIRLQLEDEKAEQRKSASSLIAFDLSKMRRGLAQLLVMIDETLINARRGPVIAFISGGGRINRARITRMLESWFDAKALWAHMNPTLVRADVIEAVGDLLAERDEIITDLAEISSNILKSDAFLDHLIDIQDKLRALDGRVKHAISLLEHSGVT